MDSNTKDITIHENMIASILGVYYFSEAGELHF